MIVFVTAIVVFINFVIDPFWLFSHENRFNARQIAYNEREQRTNYLTYNYAPYNALLIGNSRVAYMNQNDFRGLSVFNYAVSAMLSQEYKGYVEYAQRITNHNIKTVFLGLSFASANGQLPAFVKEHPPEYYFSRAGDPLNRLHSVFDPKQVRYSWKTFRYNFFREGSSRYGFVRKERIHGYYDRHNVLRAEELTTAHKEEDIAIDLNGYLSVYTTSFNYDPAFKGNLMALVKDNPGVHFVVFTTPVSRSMHCLVKKAHLEKQYEQWLRDIVDVFGSVEHFEYFHSVANDKKNFLDANHYYPEVGTLIIHKLQGDRKGVPQDFGMTINRSNLEQQLAFLRRNIDSCQ